MRWFLVFLVGFLLGGVVCAKDLEAWEGPCQDRGVRKTITCAARHWDVVGGPAKARSVARCESGYRPGVRNGRFKGVYQIGGREYRTWLSKFPVMRRDWVSGPLDGRSNVLVAVRTVHRIGSWQPWAAGRCA